jgi:predicted nucleotidyltransferase
VFLLFALSPSCLHYAPETNIISGMKRVINSLKSKLSDVAIPGGVEAIYLYGSIVTNRVRADSDIDVAILPSPGIDDLKRLELISKIQSIFAFLFSKTGFKQEISVLDLRGKYSSIQLLYKVITEGVLVFQRDRLHRLDFENAVKREYFDFKPFLKLLRKEKYRTLSQREIWMI